MRRVPVYRRSVLKFALTCAVVVGSVAFAANSALAAEYSIENDSQSGSMVNSIFNQSYYADGNILNVANNISVGDNLPTIDGISLTIQGATQNVILYGNKNGSSNSGYQLSNGSTLTINNLTFSNFSKDGSFLSYSELYGSGLYVIDNTSSVILNGVSFTGNSLNGQASLGSKNNLYGGAVANNNGTIEISGGTISGNSAHANDSGFLTSSGTAYGGAVYNSGTMSISGTTISNNYTHAEGNNSYGGAIYNSGTLTLTNNTISNNYAEVSSRGGSALGGGIYTTGDITLAGGNTFSNNTDNNGNRANDIYFAGGNLLVNGTGSDEVNTISSGLASSGNSNVILSNGGKLLLNGNNTGFTNGNANVGSDSVLTYGGAGNQSILSGITTVDGNNGAVEFNLDDASYNLDAGKVVTANGVQGQFIKSGDNTLNLTNGDYSSFSGDVIINSGILNYRGGGVYQYVFKSDCSRCDVKL